MTNGRGLPKQFLRPSQRSQMHRTIPAFTPLAAAILAFGSSTPIAAQIVGQQSVRLDQPGTYAIAIPAESSDIKLHCWGAGGGGGRSQSPHGGGGGGGGAYQDVAIPEGPLTLDVQVGEAGAAGVDGVTTRVSANGINYCIAGGGRGGTAPAGGPGGIATSGSGFDGGSGHQGVLGNRPFTPYDTALPDGGAGGDSGGAGKADGSGGAGGAGGRMNGRATAGGSPGGGGGGGAQPGFGGHGMVIIEYLGASVALGGTGPSMANSDPASLPIEEGDAGAQSTPAPGPDITPPQPAHKLAAQVVGQRTLRVEQPGTYSIAIPAETNGISLHCWGAGGGGGPAQTPRGGGGGGGGAYQDAAIPQGPLKLDVQVGQAGAAGVDGIATRVSANGINYCIAGGGRGGSAPAGGPGGSTSGSGFDGGSGHQGMLGNRPLLTFETAVPDGGAGGDSGGAGKPGGVGGAGGAGGRMNAPAAAGGSPGGGGGGGGAQPGFGGNGMVMIEYLGAEVALDGPVPTMANSDPASIPSDDDAGSVQSPPAPGSNDSPTQFDGLANPRAVVASPSPPAPAKTICEEHPDACVVSPGAKVIKVRPNEPADLPPR